MAISIKQYQFDRICDQMKKEYGQIKKGDEETHMMLLFPMEGNLLKTYRRYPSSNGRRLLEAFSLVMFQINGRLEGEEYDLSAYQSPDNERLVHALLMSFDPFTNEEIKKILKRKKIVDLTDKNQLKEYYKQPISCMLRIKESVETWEKRMGTNGYFAFIEDYIGRTIPQNEELKYSILL